MNVDGAGEIWCPVVIEPPVIAEPAVRGRQYDELTRARMVEAERPFTFLPMHGGNAGLIGWQLIGFPGPRMSYAEEIEEYYGRPFRPEDFPLPEDAYGHAKLATERALAAVAAETGLELVILRPPNWLRDLSQ